ncbi:unnamed protein product [Nesidiocoris tenuis]|uniref:Uncharacterized protein n=1 Tax=Nesidiocoris tenuis TaxID=355587 RepID=A0A6H5GYU7_9HEMI|nr:unnamed protein product [Nesidiocoris tenuis]CAB0009380.1 unnamed protein product [Nesidiocoris tenuis]
MATSNFQHTITLFGKSVNLEEECKKVAGQLGDMCGDQKFIESSKEIARLKLKIKRLQDAYDGCQQQNSTLTSMNDNLSDKVKDLISLQDSQLEKYSTTLMFLMQERKDLLNGIKTWQKEVKYWKKQARKQESEKSKESSDDGESVVCSVVPTESTLVSNGDDANAVDQNIVTGDAQIDQKNAVATPLEKPDMRRILGSGGRHMDSMESSIESCRSLDLAKHTPASCKGSFVNSMVQKLESKDKKYKLKSFDEPHHAESVPMTAVEADTVKTFEATSDDRSQELEILKNDNAKLQFEVDNLRQTCESLSSLLERTYEEMQLSSLQPRDEKKDQLIACLRARLLEAISDLMKTDNDFDVKSVACGDSLVHESFSKAPEPCTPGQAKSEPALSPSRASRALFTSPASKLKAFRAEQCHKLKKLSCWNNHEESA